MTSLATRFGLVLSMTFLLGACTSSEDALRNHGYSEAYVEGYHDGCPSGRHSAGSWFDPHVQDDERFRNDHDYQVGWTYGFQTCSTEYLSLQNAIAAGTHTGNIGTTGVDAKKVLKGIDTSGLENLGQ
jgi:hypothetical protein